MSCLGCQAALKRLEAQSLPPLAEPCPDGQKHGYMYLGPHDWGMDESLHLCGHGDRSRQPHVCRKLPNEWYFNTSCAVSRLVSAVRVGEGMGLMWVSRCGVRRSRGERETAGTMAGSWKAATLPRALTVQVCKRRCRQACAVCWLRFAWIRRFSQRWRLALIQTVVMLATLEILGLTLLGVDCWHLLIRTTLTVVAVGADCSVDDSRSKLDLHIKLAQKGQVTSSPLSSMLWHDFFLSVSLCVCVRGSDAALSGSGGVHVHGAR